VLKVVAENAAFAVGNSNARDATTAYVVRRASLVAKRPNGEVTCGRGTGRNCRSRTRAARAEGVRDATTSGEDATATPTATALAPTSGSTRGFGKKRPFASRGCARRSGPL